MRWIPVASACSESCTSAAGRSAAVAACLLFLVACQAQTAEDASYSDYENATSVDYVDPTDVNMMAADAGDNAAETDLNASASFANGNEADSLTDNAGTAEEQPVPRPPVDRNDGTAEIEKGLGAFVEPGDMEVGNWHSLEFVVGPDKTAIRTETEGLTLAQPRSIYVSSAMRVTLLRDANFETQAKTPDLQRTGADKTASWQWNVKPVRDGNQRLEAKVEVLKQTADGRYEFVDDYTSRVDISVEVGTWEGFLNALRNAATLGDVLTTLFRTWEKTLLALTAFVVAAFGLWWAIRKRRR